MSAFGASKLDLSQFRLIAKFFLVLTPDFAEPLLVSFLKV